MVPAWHAALAYSMQLYFDFSGYSDMAIGLGLMFNLRLPLNFNSPYKAAGIIAYWQRWHMTLTRTITLLLYNPIALWVTRWRASRGLPGARHHGRFCSHGGDADLRDDGHRGHLARRRRRSFWCSACCTLLI